MGDTALSLHTLLHVRVCVCVCRGHSRAVKTQSPSADQISFSLGLGGWRGIIEY